MNSRFRIGIVGSGAVARVCHVPAVLASPLATLTALVDPAAERARGIARDYGVAPLIASSLSEVLGKVDGVVIATPNNTHAPLALEAIAADIPCLIEKPLCITADEGRRICEAAEARGVVVTVGYCQRFDDGVVLVKELLDEGSLGSVRRFHCQSGSIGGWSPESGYILDRKSAGGGVLTVNGSHYIDRLLYWFGYPDDVSLRHDGVAGPEAHCHAKLHYKSRALRIDGSMLFSKLVRLDSGVVLGTERGVLATGVREAPSCGGVPLPPSSRRSSARAARRAGGRRRACSSASWTISSRRAAENTHPRFRLKSACNPCVFSKTCIGPRM